jgi:hypothetical protein
MTVEALADEAHLRALRAEVGLARRGRDRRLLGDADLALLAARRDHQADREQADHQDDWPDPGAAASGGSR